MGSLRAYEIDELMSWERLPHILMPALAVLTPKEQERQSWWEQGVFAAVIDK